MSEGKRERYIKEGPNSRVRPGSTYRLVPLPQTTVVMLTSGWPSSNGPTACMYSQNQGAFEVEAGRGGSAELKPVPDNWLEVIGHIPFRQPAPVRQRLPHALRRVFVKPFVNQCILHGVGLASSSATRSRKASSASSFSGQNCSYWRIQR